MSAPERDRQAEQDDAAADYGDDPTLGEVYWVASGGVGLYGQLNDSYRRQIEAGAAAAGAAAIARLAQGEPQPAPELAAERDQLRDRIALVAAWADREALGNSPSKKSQILEDVARRIREATA